MGELKISDTAKQKPLNDNCFRSDMPAKPSEFLPVGPFRMWLEHLIKVDGFELREVAELVQLNERTIRRLLNTKSTDTNCQSGSVKAQERVSFETVDWALTKADGSTQLWHLYPELYEDFIDCDIEILA